MIAVSIISHGHGSMVNNLINQILKLKEVTKIIITFNIYENITDFPKDSKIKYIINKRRCGFGANHNAAFKYADEEYFCVINPDIEFLDNLFPALLKNFKIPNVKLVAPLVITRYGEIEDSMRYSPTLKSLIRKLMYGDKGGYQITFNDPFFYPNWVAGMFMLFESSAYELIGGFDESFFMYYEDVDICERLWLSGGKIVGEPSYKVVHDARRASHRNLLHMRWHFVSMMRYLWKYR